MDLKFAFRTVLRKCVDKPLFVVSMALGLMIFHLPTLSAQFGEAYHYRAHADKDFENIKEVDIPIWVRIDEKVITISMNPHMTYEFTYSYKDYQDDDNLGCMVYKLDLVTMVDSYNRDRINRKVAPPFRRVEEGSYMVCNTDSGHHFARLQYEFITIFFIDKIE